MCGLPVQEGNKCGAYATAYYIFFQSGEPNRDILAAGKINDIYTEVRLDGQAGSHPTKIKNYLLRTGVVRSVELYVPEKVDCALQGLKTSFLQAGYQEYEFSYTNISEVKKYIAEKKYAITLWLPTGWKPEAGLAKLHYMLAKADTDTLSVIDSNNPNISDITPNWQTVTDLNELKLDTGAEFQFTGLIIK